MEITCYCAVDAFVLITGYMASNKTANYSKIANLWFQTFFYSCIITVILAVAGFNVDLGIKEIIKISMPVIFSGYWFFTAYFGLFLARPILDRWLFSIEENSARRWLVAIVLFCSAMGFLTDPLRTNGGYSFVWVCILYCIGVLARKCHLFEEKNSVILLGYLVGSITITWAIKVFLGIGALVSYISPTILLNALLLVILFSRLQLNGRIVSKLSPLAFGIYLFHENPAFRAQFVAGSVPLSPFLTGTFLNVSLSPILMGTLVVLGFAAALFLAGLAVDFIRLQLFKLLHIDCLIDKVVNAIGLILDKLCWLVEKIF